MRKKEQLYEVEIKSQALLREGKNGFICYFKGGNKKTIVMNAQVMYPQYTAFEDKPVINVTPIKFSEYQNRLNSNVVEQKQKLLQKEGNFV
jgi:hypothetical protein